MAEEITPEDKADAKKIELNPQYRADIKALMGVEIQ